MASPMRAGADMRLLRAAVFTAVCVGLSAGAHILASGHGVPFWTSAVGWLAVFAVVAPFAGRERSLPGIATGLAVGQLALHTLFNAGRLCMESAGQRRGDNVMALAGRLLCNDHMTGLTPQAAARVVRAAGLDPSSAPAPMGPFGSMGTSGSMTSGSTVTSGAMDPFGHQAGAMHSAMTYSLPMFLAHLLAALAAGWLLRRGETALWQLVRLSADALLRVAFALVRVLVAGTDDNRLSALRPRRFDYRHGLPGTVRLRHALARRGPPAYSLAA